MNLNRLINRRIRPLALAALLLSILGAGDANAAVLTLRLTQGASTITITDNDASDAAVASGQITYVGGLGVFAVAISTGVSNSPGSAFNGAVLQVNSLDVRNSAAGQGTLLIELSDKDFTLPLGLDLDLDSSVAGTFLSAGSGDYMTFQSFASSSNLLFATHLTPGIQIELASPQSLQAFDNEDSKNVDLATTFSLYNRTEVNLSGNAQINFSGTTNVIPEPATFFYVLLGAGSLLLSRRYRRLNFAQ